MNRKQKRLVRILAMVLAVLLLFGAVISAVISVAYAEESPVNQQEFTMEYLNEEQALRVSQRLVYFNVSDSALDRVIFYAPANMFRRQSALFYESDALLTAFPNGYLPGGIELTNVCVNGESVDWGYQGTDENYLRVECDLQPEESCTFEFEYYLLLTNNGAFLGVSEGECRLSDFYFAPASLDESGEFILNMPTSYTRYIDTPAADFSVSIVLPEELSLSATGTENVSISEGNARAWTVQAENVHDFAMVIQQNMKEIQAVTASGIALSLHASSEKNAKRVLAIASEAIESCEKWFGAFPFSQIDIVQTNYLPGALPHSACLWLPKDLLRKDDRTLALAIRYFIAQQYFGRSAWAHPASDAWLSDSICEFLSYLILEESEGHEAYLAALNEDLVNALRLTIPGGLVVSSDASLFTEYEYEIVVRQRGAIVFHELYTAMGRANLLAGLKCFYEKGKNTAVLSEMDLVNALDEASGKSWKKYLTDWIFNVGDYVNQDIFWLD